MRALGLRDSLTLRRYPHVSIPRVARTARSPDCSTIRSGGLPPGEGSTCFHRQWSDQFIPSIKTIVGPLLLVETPDEIDCNQAADLMVFSARNMRIAARVRRHGYADRFPYEFTLRCARDSGAETELSNVLWSRIDARGRVIALVDNRSSDIPCVVNSRSQ